MGAWNHWLPSAYLLGDTHPHPGMSEALGVGPHQPHPASEELPRKPKPGTAFPSPVGQTMPEKQRHVQPGYCLRERERRPGRPDPTAFPGPASTWNHWAGQLLLSTTQGPLLLRYEPLQA